MSYESFYIVISGKKSFSRELSELFDNFDLLASKPDYKAFLAYLAAEYLVADPVLKELFPILYKRYQNGNRLIQGQRLLDKLYGRGEVAQRKRRLKRAIKDLTAAVLRFRALRLLEEQPAELHRLIVKSVSPEVRPRVYRRVLADYKHSAAAIPRGVDRALHHWQAAFLGHYSLSAPKENNHSTTFAELGAATQQLTELLGLVFRCETVNRNGVWQDEHQPATPSPLSGLYTRLIALFERADFDERAYNGIKADFLRMADQLSDDQQYAVVAYLVNYLNRQFRYGLEIADKEVFSWTEWQLRPEVYPSFRALSKTWLLNQVGNAVALGKRAVADRIIELHQHRMAPEEREVTIIHARAILHLSNDEHAKNYRLITRAFHDHQLLPHTDGVRLKSYRLMSVLCLYAEAPRAWEDKYTLALRDFEIFFSRVAAGVEARRLAFYQNMLIIVRKCHNALARYGHLAPVFAELLELIENSDTLHARKWLRTFVWHFNPEKPPVLPVRPWANTGLVPQLDD